MSGKIHLVTGGSGFLGHLIVRRLLEKGERVRALDVWESPDHPPEAEFVNCSVLDRDGVAKAMRDVGIVHHNAALVPLTKSGAQFAEVNHTGSKIMAEEAARAGADAFVHMSSTAIFGKGECPITNNTPLAPFEIYGRAKLEGERAARAPAEPCRLSQFVRAPFWGWGGWAYSRPCLTGFARGAKSTSSATEATCFNSSTPAT